MVAINWRLKLLNINYKQTGTLNVHVLIVEDDLSIADLLQEALEADGYRVTGIASTVEGALRSAEQHPPDFAVVDIRLANGDLGTDVAAHFRTTTIKVIFSTGNGNHLSEMSALGEALMIKPYRLSDVGRGLKIIDQIARFGQTKIPFPRNFQLLAPAV